jgi:hypothetical protein
MPSTVDVVTWLFVTANVCRLFTYLPKVPAALMRRNGAASAFAPPGRRRTSGLKWLGRSLTRSSGGDDSIAYPVE